MKSSDDRQSTNTLNDPILGLRSCGEAHLRVLLPPVHGEWGGRWASLFQDRGTHIQAFAMRTLIFLCFLCLFCGTMPAGADEGAWVACTGRAALHHITPEEAEAKALEEARRDAVEQVCGVRLQAETLVRNARLASDFIHSISFGHVVEERNVRWKTEETQVVPNEPPSMSYVVTMEARVVQEQGEPDPAFRVSVTLNRTTFEAGD